MTYGHETRDTKKAVRERVKNFKPVCAVFTTFRDFFV
jgi:hypothetical protein